MVRIGIDYTPAYEQGGGIGRLVRDLISYLAKADSKTNYRLFIAGTGDSPPALAPNFTWRTTRLTPTWLARIWHRAHLSVPIETFTGPLDLYHATDFVLPPVRRSTRTIVTVHDLSFVRVPETATPSLKAYLDIVVPQSVRRADHVIADSAATKRDLIDLYNLPSEKITVLLSGIDDRFAPFTGDPATVLRKYQIPQKPYIFSIGTVQPRKNYARIVKSLVQLRDSGLDIDLVIAGGKGWLDGSLYQTIKDTGMSDHIHMIGFADEADIPVLYSAATCTAFPSLYEGFGFPVLESMACGTPVVTSNVSSLPEVAGDAALIVDPYDVDALANALRKLTTDEAMRDLLIQRGFQQAANFSWDDSARSLKEIYWRVLA